jgi:hypothetical protein
MAVALGERIRGSLWNAVEICGPMLALFADDAEFTLAPGTFRGKEEIRKVLEWDVRLSPTASVREAGIGVLAGGHAAVGQGRKGLDA